MQLKAKEDVEAPQDRVFAEITDFQQIERQALRRGIQVQRTGKPFPITPGIVWHTGFGFRGKTRTADITLTEVCAPERIVFDSVSGGLKVRMELDLVALSRVRTRISVTTVLAPQTLSARLLVQSMKLARGGLEKRFRRRVALLARDLENRLQGTA